MKFEPIGGSVETPAPAKPEPPPPVVAAAPPEKLPAHLLPPPKDDAVVQQTGRSLPALAVEAVVLWLGQNPPLPVRIGAICRQPRYIRCGCRYLTCHVTVRGNLSYRCGSWSPASPSAVLPVLNGDAIRQ